MSSFTSPPTPSPRPQPVTEEALVQAAEDAAEQRRWRLWRGVVSVVVGLLMVGALGLMAWFVWRVARGR